jgi:AcrR family transcriptional regulator
MHDEKTMALKQPLKTRHAILEAAFWEIYRNGFQTASVDQILEGTGLTKGALYHHFPNKRELGYAVVAEVIRPWLIGRWTRALDAADDPVEGIKAAVMATHDAPPEMMCGGCPLFNLTQELANSDEAFRGRLERVLDDWRGTLSNHLARGQARGQVRPDLDPDATSAFLVAAFEGISGMAKAQKSRDVAERLFGTFLTLVDTLRPAGSPL